jgi:hypothetical protein
LRAIPPSQEDSSILSKTKKNRENLQSKVDQVEIKPYYHFTSLSGRLAQLVEQLTLNQRVTGSSPVAPTNIFYDLVVDLTISKLLGEHMGSKIKKFKNF